MIAKMLSASAVAGAILFSCAGLDAATAAPAAIKATDQAPAVRTVAAVTDTEEDQANCTRARRRMFVDGEGWIVRRVTTCR